MSLALDFLIGSHDSTALTVADVNKTVRSFSPFPPITNADRSSKSMSSMSRLQSSETLSPVSSNIVTIGEDRGSSELLDASLRRESSDLPKVRGNDFLLEGL